MDGIVAALERFETPGNFFTQTSLDARELHVKVKNVGVLSSPVTTEQAQSLIKIAQPAKFGFKDKTLLDENVRRAWKVAKSYVGIAKKEWERAMEPTLEQLKSELGMPQQATLDAEFHDLLVYEPGCFFKPHQDTEKSEGMIATLVMLLPSEYEGGELVVYHKGKKATFKQEKNKHHSKILLAAFYADCHHEVKPLKRGYRVALTFNLMLRNYYGNTSSLNCTDSHEGLRNAVMNHFDRVGERPTKAIYLLDYQYTQHSLSWDNLKDFDAKRVGALLTIAEELELDAYLTLADVRENWHCEYEYDDYYYRRRSRRRYYDDTDYDSSDVTPVELIDTEIELKHWLNHSGKPSDIQSYCPGYKEVGWTGGNESFEPFDSEYEGWMGNYGNTLDRWYHRAAIVLWRKADHHAVMFELDKVAYIENIFSLGRVKKNIGQVKSMLRSIVPYWNQYLNLSPPREHEKKILNLIKSIDEKQLAARILEHYKISLFNLKSIPTWLVLAEQYGYNWLLGVLEKFHKEERTGYHYSSKQILIENIDKIFKKLTTNSRGKKLANFLVSYQYQSIKHNHKQEKHTSDIDYKEGAITRCNEISQYMMSLIVFSQPTLLEKCMNYIKKSPKTYPPLEVCAACYKHLKQMADISNVSSFVLYLNKSIKKEYAQGLRNEDDWRIGVNSNCSCSYCQTLNEFFSAKDKHEIVWPINEGLRRHIGAEIDKLKQPIKYYTKELGRPYKLVIVKLTDLHVQAVKRFKLVERMLGVLNS